MIHELGPQSLWARFLCECKRKQFQFVRSIILKSQNHRNETYARFQRNQTLDVFLCEIYGKDVYVGSRAGILIFKTPSFSFLNMKQGILGNDFGIASLRGPSKMSGIMNVGFVFWIAKASFNSFWTLFNVGSSVRCTSRGVHIYNFKERIRKEKLWEW